jgi:integrase
MFARVLDYARAKGMRSGDNPASWKGMHEYRFARVRKTERGHFAALPYEQIPDFMKELRLRQGRGVGSVAPEFTILTAARTSEVLGMTWAEIDWTNQTWTVPKGRMKMGREHVVPLSEASNGNIADAATALIWKRLRVRRLCSKTNGRANTAQHSEAYELKHHRPRLPINVS